MGDEHHSPNVIVGNKRRGIIWFTTALAAFGISFVCFYMSFNRDWGSIVSLASIIGISISSLFIVLGTILFFVENRKKRMRINSIVTFCIGVIAIVVAVKCFLSAFGSGDIGQVVRGVVLGYIFAPIGVLFASFGMIMFLVWNHESKHSNAD